MRPRLPSPRLDRLRAEDGISLIEVLVAILLLTVGVVGLLGGFNSARSLTLLSERHTTMAHRAQLEIERLQTIPYKELALSEKPSESSETSNPDHYVSAGSTLYQWDPSKSETAALVINTTSGTVPVSLSSGTQQNCPSGTPTAKPVNGNACKWNDGSLEGYIYDFVTWDTSSNTKSACETNVSGTNPCPMRLTVVVTDKVPSGSKEVTALRVSTLRAES